MKITLAICIIILIYPTMRLTAALQQGYSWDEMDWDQDGQTSINDLFAASEIGRRPIEFEGEKCREYFLYKDGSTVKRNCN